MTESLYFEYDFPGDDPSTYANRTVQIARDWQKREFDETLFATFDEKTCYLWDFRPISRQPVTELNGTERELYEFCGRGRHRRAISEWAEQRVETSVEDIDSFLQQMVDQRLMMQDEDI